MKVRVTKRAQAHIDREVGLARPPREVRDAAEVPALSAGGVAALPQILGECIDVRRENAVE